MNLKNFFGIFILTFFLTFPIQKCLAATKSIVESNNEFNGAIYFSISERWSVPMKPEETTTIDLIKFFDKNDNYQYILYISGSGRQSFPLSQFASIHIENQKYSIKQIEEHTVIHDRIWKDTRYTLYEISDDLVKIMAETSAKTEIYILMNNMANSETYKAVLKQKFRTSIPVLYSLTRKDFDTYLNKKLKPKEGEEFPKIITIQQ